MVGRREGGNAEESDLLNVRIGVACSPPYSCAVKMLCTFHNEFCICIPPSKASSSVSPSSQNTVIGCYLLCLTAYSNT